MGNIVNTKHILQPIRLYFKVLFEARFCCGMHSELVAYFGDHSTDIEHKLKTEQEIASSNLKYIYIFKRIYFKCISLSFQ